MADETITLAGYAAGLSFEQIPPEVVRRAKDCIADTVGAIVFGHELPWSRMIVEEMQASGGEGRSHILGSAGGPIHAGGAALANGALAHAFELDSLRKPSAGVHPGAILLPAALAVAQDRGAGGRALVTSFVAGCEGMFRIGKATKHSAETRGFHAPGLTGTFGAAMAAGHIAALRPEAMANALGIAGSLSSGLLEFAKSGTGGMVKRLHLGRAAEGGVLAARLAEKGFTGPSTVLEGRFGFLNGYCTETDVAALTAGLGHEFETLKICLKRYPCHITAHSPVTIVERLRREHGFTANDVVSVAVTGSPKMTELHDIKAPDDLIMAQYSIPFCVAVALCADPIDPASFSETTLRDPTIRDLCARVDVIAATPPFSSAWETAVAITLKDGRRVENRLDDFPGTPARPLSPDELWQKFSRLTGRLEPGGAANLFERLQHLEREPSLEWLAAPPQRR